ncbi:MAG: ribonuclease [Sphingobacteriales bacterium 17-39-43]|uniref:PhoH family protein n=1 Tax=Daejeonella sp. TaxID=2805397 RepID=UPI000BC575E8|nr:PhoH family protein [Daejeonella sp.]OYZ32897.1 MAG: ribonuclease [Sphingobacteriales bacterium 16-39-50]OZA26307.1 MAG: ribonuclease [Sphingobacteriales bacterium 17-39-43]HQT23522.1 PhoH family protein [Daejeonella sp.]HQT56163.1 PhoH family protein [Daejeonella sp.]
MAKDNSTVSDKKIFVLDTSVILYDHNAFQNFQEHDVAIPIQVLEELDNLKSGNDTRNYEARSFIRLMDELSKNKLINEWSPLKGKGRGSYKVVMDDIPNRVDAEKIFGEGKFDHRILNSALNLQEQFPQKKIVLVSKDICLRLKAKALNLYSEDYETGKIKNVEELYTGKTVVENFSNKLIDELTRKKNLPISVSEIKTNHENHFFILNGRNKTAAAYYNPRIKELEYIPHQSVYNIEPRNPEQAFAIHALLNPEIKLVTIQGNAGTGKTLLALASALEQRKNYRQIFVTRPIVPLSNKDIGFLPGDIKSKIDPYMAPIWDNLKFIKDQLGDEKAQDKIDELVSNEKISIAPLAYIRGRTLTKIFFIVDEAQNLTPHEIKTIISRAGEDTKIVFTGDIYQIDTPYLDAESNGLSYLIDRAKNHSLYAHITLQKGERSELANLANDLL